MAHPVNWFQIQGLDGKALQAFYKKVFAWKMSPFPDGSMMVAPEAGGIPGGVGSTLDGQNASLAVYVGVDNLVAHLAKIEKAGGKTAMPPMELPQGMGSIAGFTDPAGNWVGLWQPGSKLEEPKKQANGAPKRAAKKAAAKAPAKKAAKKVAKKAAPKAAAKPKRAARPKKK